MPNERLQPKFSNAAALALKQAMAGKRTICPENDLYALMDVACKSSNCKPIKDSSVNKAVKKVDHPHKQPIPSYTSPFIPVIHQQIDRHHSGQQKDEPRAKETEMEAHAAQSLAGMGNAVYKPPVSSSTSPNPIPSKTTIADHTSSDKRFRRMQQVGAGDGNVMMQHYRGGPQYMQMRAMTSHPSGSAVDPLYAYRAQPQPYGAAPTFMFDVEGKPVMVQPMSHMPMGQIQQMFPGHPMQHYHMPPQQWMMSMQPMMMSSGQSAGPAVPPKVDSLGPKKRSANSSEEPNKATKLRRVLTMPPASWLRAIQDGCRNTFRRLDVKAESEKLQDSILRRIERGAAADDLSAQHPCFIVGRDTNHPASPIQIQISKSRILAQKVLYAGYHKLPVSAMGNWQCCQTCTHHDGTWWCFEPSHLRKCDKHHLSLHQADRSPRPANVDALYIARNRQSNSMKFKGKNEEEMNVVEELQEGTVE